MSGSQKIFGVGLSRTGTTSLTEALRMLSYKSIHYPLCIVRRRNGKLELDTRCIEKYDALTDMPVARFYKELDPLYPGSKFILTIRDTDSWVKSMRRLRYSLPLLKFFPRVTLLVKDMFGVMSYDDEARLVDSYERHKKDVLAYFRTRPDDLLVFDVKENKQWERLCEFLHKPVPAKRFPWHNRGYATSMNNIIDFIGIRTDAS